MLMVQKVYPCWHYFSNEESNSLSYFKCEELWNLKWKQNVKTEKCIFLLLV